MSGITKLVTEPSTGRTRDDLVLHKARAVTACEVPDAAVQWHKRIQQPAVACTYMHSSQISSQALLLTPLYTSMQAVLCTPCAASACTANQKTPKHGYSMRANCTNASNSARVGSNMVGWSRRSTRMFDFAMTCFGYAQRNNEVSERTARARTAHLEQV